MILEFNYPSKNILEKLIEALQRDDKFVSEGGLLKNKIIESALSLDSVNYFVIGCVFKNLSKSHHIFANSGGGIVS